MAIYASRRVEAQSPSRGAQRLYEEQDVQQAGQRYERDTTQNGIRCLNAHKRCSESSVEAPPVPCCCNTISKQETTCNLHNELQHYHLTTLRRLQGSGIVLFHSAQHIDLP